VLENGCEDNDPGECGDEKMAECGPSTSLRVVMVQDPRS
jgi:hypothetical protein